MNRNPALGWSIPTEPYVAPIQRFLALLIPTLITLLYRKPAYVPESEPCLRLFNPNPAYVPESLQKITLLYIIAALRYSNHSLP